jgi:hypothetical protein
MPGVLIWLDPSQIKTSFQGFFFLKKVKTKMVWKKVKPGFDRINWACRVNSYPV